MPTITVKNIPDNLYEALKMRARLNRRSLNSEILITLEEAAMPRPVDVAALIAKARQLREITADYQLTDELLRQARDEGRP